jgi:hypothetical protein
MNEKESLAIITEMIEKTKSNIKDQSGYFLMWGWLVLLACAAQFALLTIYPVDWHWAVWPVLMTIGGIGTFALSAKQSKAARTMTFIDRTMAFLWSAWAILLIIVFIWSGSAGIAWGQIYVAVIAMYGMATLTTGGLLKFKPLIYGGILSYAIALICIFANLSGTFHIMLLMLALSVAVSYLIPGYLLKNS